MTRESQLGLGQVAETLRMVEVEHLDIRTVTLGLSLLDLAGADSQLPDRIYRRVTEIGGSLVTTAEEVEADLGVPIINKRVSVTPIALVAAGADEPTLIECAKALDAAAVDIGVDYIAGYSALVHKGAAAGDARLIASLPKALGATSRLCGSVNVASTKSGINVSAITDVARSILELAHQTSTGIGCARFVCFANAVEDNPFIAGAFHGVGEPQAALNVGISGPGVVHHAVRRLVSEQGHNPDLGSVADVIKRMAFKVTRAGELIGRVVAKRLGVDFGVVDLSLAPTPAEGDSVADILTTMGLAHPGAPGGLAALMLLTDAVKKGGAMATSYVGGLSGAFIPVSEDQGMIRSARDGSLTFERLESMTSICSVGLDMVAIPGDTPQSTVAGLIADQMAIGVINNKTTAARLLPIPGGRTGDVVEYGDLLGDAVVMRVSPADCSAFIGLGGRIPAPIHSLRN